MDIQGPPPSEASTLAAAALALTDAARSLAAMLEAQRQVLPHPPAAPEGPPVAPVTPVAPEPPRAAEGAPCEICHTPTTLAPCAGCNRLSAVCSCSDVLARLYVLVFLGVCRVPCAQTPRSDVRRYQRRGDGTLLQVASRNARDKGSFEDASFQPRSRGEGWWFTAPEASYLLGALGGVATARAARELAAAFDLAGERLGAFVASLIPREAPRAPVRLPTAAERAALERAAIVAALAEHQGNRVAAARALGIARRTFYRRLREFGLE